jgi:hypothetical protein
MATPSYQLPSLDAGVMSSILETKAVQYGWDERYKAVIVGKLKRGPQSIAPFDAKAASTIIAMCREGYGLYHALKHSGISQRRYFAWIANAHSDALDRDTYQDFRNQLITAINDNAATTGIQSLDHAAELNKIVP